MATLGEEIAICGYGYRVPGGLESDEAIWKLLAERGFVQEAISQRYGPNEVPWDGFNESPGRAASPYEGLITGGRELEFDCPLFGMSANDARRMDPQIKMMLSVTWEALECAGMDQAALHNSNTGVFTGHQTSAVAAYRPPMGVEDSDVPGRSGSMIANRISYHFNWKGPSFSVATACSSGITALDAAVKSLNCKECDVAAFGAVQYLGFLGNSIGFNHMGIISSTGTSRSFDKNANGYMRSEGAFMYILKRLSDAERDGDRIFGTIRGCALNTAGAEPDAEILTQGRMIVAPVALAQEQLMAKVSQLAGVDPQTVDYIEAHATGTTVGDKTEGNAIANVYGGESRQEKLRLASARSNMGHMEAASFTMSLLKVLLMLRKRHFLPVSSHFKEPNPNIPFEAKNLIVQTECEPFPERAKPVVVGINSFGFGGSNGHCLIQEYKPRNNWSRAPGNLSGKIYMAPLTAKSEDALVENARNLARRVRELKETIDLYKVISNLSVRTTHHRVRTAFTASSLTELQEQLQAFAERADEGKLDDNEVNAIQQKGVGVAGPSVVMVFPGQGSQWAGCGRSLYETELVFRRVVDTIDSEWTRLTRAKLSDVAFDEEIGDKLNEVQIAQPVTFLLQAAMFELLKSQGVHPVAVVGHSAGEAASAYASGAYTLEEATELVYHRSVAQSKTSGSGRMLVLMQDSDSVKQKLTQYGCDDIEIACYNSPTNTVVCGSDEAVARLREKLEDDGLPNGKLIPGSIAFHSTHMEPIKDELVENLTALHEVSPCKTEIPFISTVTARALGEFDANYWYQNVREPVNLLGALQFIRKHVKPAAFIEVSPHITLRSPIRDFYEGRAENLPPYLFTLLRRKDTSLMFNKFLGNCFKAGVSIDFRSLYPRPEPITSLLPRYAMKREQVLDPILDDSAQLKQEVYYSGPLLGIPLQGSYPRYQAVMSKKHMLWMADHQVQEKSIYPAAGYIELLLEAFKGEPVHIESARLLAPFVLNQDRRYLHTEIKPFSYAPHRYEFSITSRVHVDNDMGSTVHCCGIVEKRSLDAMIHNIPDDTPRTLSAVSGNFEDVHDSAESYYTTMMSKIGDNFQYGPYFQVVKKIERDLDTLNLRCEISLDEDLFAKWNKMGYVLHPALLDGCLQTFILYLMEASDFNGIPQEIENFVFLKKPTTHKIVCIFALAKGFIDENSQRGVVHFKLGEMLIGSILVYDEATGDMIAYLGGYNTYTSNNVMKSDLRRSKHFLSWQPKDCCQAEVLAAPVVKALGTGCQLGSAAEALIKSLTESAHPNRGTPFFLNVGECVLGKAPSRLVLDGCVKTISNGPVQYSVISTDTEYLVEQYQHVGKSNNDAHLRFTKLDDDPDFLRPGMFELAIVRITAIEEESEEDLEEDFNRLVPLVSPGGLILIESNQEDVKLPAGWRTMWSSQDSFPDVTPKLFLLNAGGVEATTDPTACHVIVDDMLGYADAWRTQNGISLENKPEVDFEKAPEFKRVDFFCQSEEVDEELFKAPARLADWVKDFAAQRAGNEDIEPCIFTCYTSGGMRAVSSPTQTGVWGAVRSLAAEIGEACKVDFRLIDLACKEDLKFVPAIESMREQELCVHNGRLWTSRLINIRQTNFVSDLTSDDPSCFHLYTDGSGVISDLEYRTRPLAPLGPVDVEIEIKAAALNFRDVMVGLGKLPLLSYERSRLGHTVGMECSGVIVKAGSDVKGLKIGDKVIAMQGGCIANRIRCDERAAYKLPGNLTFEQGSAVLSVYVTAYYALCYLARIRKGQTILVHSALGGVGQAAIALAKMHGVNVYGTAGSVEKRKKLRELGCLDAFDSHSLSWFPDLMRATGGKGVNVVLNSLAGEHVDLCLESISAGGWHCEIGKVDIFADRPMRMAVFRKNLVYRAIDIDRLMMDDPELMLELTSDCLDLLRDGKVPALPTTTYKYAEQQVAIRSMMQGQHRGKLVLVPPSPGERLPVTDRRDLFGTGVDGKPRTVLLSGCMSGFGLRIFSYVLATGARHVLLMDRDPERKRSVQDLRRVSHVDFLLPTLAKEANIEIVYADVSNYDHVVDAVAAVDRLGMPPIGSVFHLAGVLDDKFIADIDNESFARVYKPKASGAWNLHRATENIDDLQHFVMFSSTSSVFGNPGQTNYSAANSFQDGLAEMRRASGKPALSFCMGAVVETGMAARNPQLLQMMKMNGMPAISTVFAIDTLDSALRSGKQPNSVCSLATTLAADVGNSDFLRIGAQLVKNAAAFKLGGDITMSKETIMELIAQRVAPLCGVEEVGSQEPFSSYGLNSISVAELIAFLKQELNYSVSAMELMTSATCESIAEGVVNSYNTTDEVQGNNSFGGEDADDGDNNAVDILTVGPMARKPSRFAPSIDEHFDGSNPTARIEPAPTVQKAKVVIRTNGIHVASTPLKRVKQLGDINGTLPPACQETLDDLYSYVARLRNPEMGQATPVEEMRTLLLTGGTGFLGRHFIADLLNNDERRIGLIYLPVRASDDAAAFQRVIDAMTDAGVWDESFRSRLHVFCGDLEDEHFGVAMEFHDQICKAVDGVYHFASNLNLAASFKELRQSNCGSFKAIAKLCMTFRKKHLFLASTLGIFPQYFCQFGKEMSGKTIEQDSMPDISLMKKIFPLGIGGYPWSKMLIEMAAYKLARENELPLAVFRLPVMYAHSGSGYTAVQDPKIRFFFAILQTRTVPVPGMQNPFNMEDAAVACEIMLRVSMNPCRRHIVYHCSRIAPNMQTECSAFAMLGFHCQPVKYRTFKAQCQKLGNKSPLQHYWGLLDAFQEYWIIDDMNSNKFDINMKTLEDDCVPVPPRSNAMRTFAASISWVNRHPEVAEYDLSLLKASIGMDQVLLPARELCDKYSMNFQSVFPQHVLDGLERLCGSIEAPTEQLPAIAFDLTTKIETRIHLHRVIEMHPEILDEPIVSPVFILGLNRTGTTFLHRLLEASGCFLAPHVEDMLTLPSAEQLVKPDPHQKAERLAYLENVIEQVSRTMAGSHDLSLGVAEEDLMAHACAFASLEYDLLFDLPEYRAWLDSLSLEEVYEDHRTWIKFILWCRRRAGATVLRPCLKMPWHARSLPALLKAYPDALLIHTHRAPEDVAGSYCALVENQRARFGRINKQRIGQGEVDGLSFTLSAAMKFREETPELSSRWLDVKFTELISSPSEVSARVLRHADIEVDEQIQERLNTHVVESTAKHSKANLVKYDLQDYGVDPGVFHKGVFKTYREEHL